MSNILDPDQVQHVVAGSSWSVAKFHWHGAWRSARKSCIHGQGSCKRGGGMMIDSEGA